MEMERPCWERNALLIRLDIRGMGGDGSGVYVQCDAERGDNEACLAHPPPPKPSMLSVPSAVLIVLHLHHR